MFFLKTVFLLSVSGYKGDPYIGDYRLIDGKRFRFGLNMVWICSGVRCLFRIPTVFVSWLLGV